MKPPKAARSSCCWSRLGNSDANQSDSRDIGALHTILTDALSVRIFLIFTRGSVFSGAGDSTFDREFLADIMLPDGNTVGEAFIPRLEESYSTGEQPSLPLLGSGS